MGDQSHRAGEEGQAELGDRHYPFRRPTISRCDDSAQGRWTTGRNGEVDDAHDEADKHDDQHGREEDLESGHFHAPRIWRGREEVG